MSRPTLANSPPETERQKALREYREAAIPRCKSCVQLCAVLREGDPSVQGVELEYKFTIGGDGEFPEDRIFQCPSCKDIVVNP